MANINEEFAAASEAAQRELAQFGVITDATAARLKTAAAGVAEFEQKMKLATAAGATLYRTFTSYNRAVLDGVKGYKDLAETTDNLASSIEAVTAALAFILPIGRVAKIVTAGLGLLAGELVRTSKAVGEQLDGLRSGFDELAQVGATTAGGLTDMYEVMQQVGLSAKDFPAFAKRLSDSSEILATFGGSVTRGRDVVTGLAESLRPMQDQLLNFGIRIEQIGDASLAFVKNQRLTSLGTNANLNLGKEAMMSYVKELDILTRLTGISRQQQEKLQEEAMSNAAYAATIDELTAEGRLDEVEAIKKAQVYFANLGPGALKGFRDSISGFVGTTQEATDLQLVSNMEVLKFADDLRAGRLKSAEEIATGAQGVYRAIQGTNETIGRAAAQMGTSFGTVYPESRRVGQLLGETAEDMVARARAEQEKRDKALAESNKTMINANAEMLKTQKTIQSTVEAYQAGINGATTGLNLLNDAARKVAEAFGFITKGKSGATSGSLAGAALASGVSTGVAAVTGPTTSISAPPPGAAVARPEQAPQMAAIRQLIAGVESQGDYNVAVGGKKYPLTDMTIDEVMKLQRELKAGPGSAMGKYQVIYGTLVEAVSKLGIKRDQKFDAATQDAIADYLIMKRGFGQYAKNPTQEGKERFLTNLAAEWAGLPAGPDNKSRYAGVGNNKANIGWTEALQMFADGGRLGAGKYGIAGEAGPELVTGPADITPINDLMSVFKDLMSAMDRSSSILERIDRNTAASSDYTDRMLRLAQN